MESLNRAIPLVTVLLGACVGSPTGPGPEFKLICDPDDPQSCAGGGGCSASDYRCLLDHLQTINLTHGRDAIAVASSFYGFGAPCAIVTWVIDPLPPAPNGENVDGVNISCSIWVEWWGPQWTSGASADGPAISFTSFPHEMAHCALDLLGTPDPHHTRADWWGSGGKVSQAFNALRAAGL